MLRHRHPTTDDTAHPSDDGAMTHSGGGDHGGCDQRRSETVSKRARKKRDRKKSSANHGKRPNS
jgi:hypothetical protein